MPNSVQVPWVMVYVHLLRCSSTVQPVQQGFVKGYRLLYWYIRIYLNRYVFYVFMYIRTVRTVKQDNQKHTVYLHRIRVFSYSLVCIYIWLLLYWLYHLRILWKLYLRVCHIWFWIRRCTENRRRNKYIDRKLDTLVYRVYTKEWCRFKI